jgi:hypothetical protein
MHTIEKLLIENTQVVKAETEAFIEFGRHLMG